MTLALFLLLIVAPLILGGILGALVLPHRPQLGRAAGAVAGPLLAVSLLWLSGGLPQLAGSPSAENLALGSIRDQCRALRTAIVSLSRLDPAPEFAAQCRRNRDVFVAECVSRRHVAAMP